MTISEINSLPRIDFVEALGGVFEHSPWVALRAWGQRPFADVDALHAAMVNEVDRATRDEQLALLRAHPDLGARASMSAASAGEQAGAGLDRLSPSEYAELHTRNAAYREKFGFPFLFAVRGAGKRDILMALRRRLARTPEEEFQEALAQVYRIARFRLEGMIV